mmetsp:Transcript_1145/g.2482  ORF Transcript_1145/g.2482 Transcript_1145/m.2482 type:complete len:242 (-) Transcript_1145:371-1096(-)
MVCHDRVLLLPSCHLSRGLCIPVGSCLGVGGALDEDMVPRILVRLDQLRCLCIGTRHKDSVCSEDVALQTGRHETVDVLPRGHENLSSHVPALLGPVLLVFEVDPSRSCLHHRLGEAHDGSHATMAGVTVGNDGTEIVDAFLEASLGPLRLELLAVVKLLGSEQSFYMLGNCVEGIVREVRTRLHEGRMMRRGLPAGDIDGLGKLHHLGELGYIEATEGHGASVLFPEGPDELKQLCCSER